MLRIRDDWGADVPAIEVRVTSADAGEALLLASSIEDVSLDYLIAQEVLRRSLDYQQSVAQIEKVQAALLEAERERAALVAGQTTYDITLEPEYMRIQAEITALQLQLGTLAGEAARLVVEGDTGLNYTAVLDQMTEVSTALSEARKKLASLQARAAVDYFDQRIAYSTVDAKVRRLQGQLDRLTETLALSEIGIVDTSIAFRNLTGPSIPAEVPPDRIRGRNAVMMGGVFGAGLAWALLNRKWIISGMPAAGSDHQEEELEEQAEGA
jgi:hypothetical protein